MKSNFYEEDQKLLKLDEEIGCGCACVCGSSCGCGCGCACTCGCGCACCCAYLVVKFSCRSLRDVELRPTGIAKGGKLREALPDRLITANRLFYGPTKRPSTTFSIILKIEDITYNRPAQYT